VKLSAIVEKKDADALRPPSSTKPGFPIQINKCRSLPDGLHQRGKEYTMPQSTHNPAAEQHNQASHAHTVAAVAHDKADHRSAHELSNQDHELSREDLKFAEQLDTVAAKSAKVKMETGEKVEAVHVIRPGLPL
jgi:hypothetical protein